MEIKIDESKIWKLPLILKLILKLSLTSGLMQDEEHVAASSLRQVHTLLFCAHCSQFLIDGYATLAQV